jgi:Transcription initiation factor IIA, gamma subunit, helical domain
VCRRCRGSMSYQVYRQSKLGDCLVEALDELITNEKITPALAMKILAEVPNCRLAEAYAVRMECTFATPVNSHSHMHMNV